MLKLLLLLELKPLSPVLSCGSSKNSTMFPWVIFPLPTPLPNLRSLGMHPITNFGSLWLTLLFQNIHLVPPPTNKRSSESPTDQRHTQSLFHLVEICAVQYGSRQLHVPSERLKCGWSAARCAVSVKCTPGFKDLAPKIK